MDIPHDGGVALFEIRCWLCDMRGQEARNYLTILEVKFGGGIAMVFILAQMFCLRNGVRTKRENRGARGRVFELFCASDLAGRLSLVRRTKKSLSH